jgi:hypothetical protein
MAQRTVDLIDIGLPMEIANRLGDNGPQYISTSSGGGTSTATVIGGQNGANQLVLNASASAAFVFGAATELGDEYRLANIGTTCTIFTPSTGFWQTGSTSSQASFSLTSGKTAWCFRVGPVPFPTGSVSADQWVYILSA